MLISRLQQIFLNDKEFLEEYLNSLNLNNISIVNFVRRLDNFLINNYKIIDFAKNFEELINNVSLINNFKSIMWNNNYPFSTNEQAISLFKYCYYKYKYGSLSDFWKENLINFFSVFDKEIINSDEELKFFFEFLGQVLDKIDDFLYKIENIYDIDKIDDEYLNYLSEFYGIKKEDLSLSLDNNAFREILKNINTFYKIKGTPKVFKAFFNLLGFDCIINEFYFDRDRFFFDDGGFFGVAENSKLLHYLTTINPEKREKYPVKNLQNSFSLNDIKEPITKEMLGITDVPNSNPSPFNNNYYYLPDNNNQFRYFKTNLIQFVLLLKEGKNTLTASDNTTIQNYIKLFFPINFILDLRVNLGELIDNFSDIIKWFIKHNESYEMTIEQLNKIWEDVELLKLENYNNYKDNIIANYNNELLTNEEKEKYINLYDKLFNEINILYLPISNPNKTREDNFGSNILRSHKAPVITNRIALKKNNNEWVLLRPNDYIERIYYRTITKIIFYDNTICFNFKKINNEYSNIVYISISSSSCKNETPIIIENIDYNNKIITINENYEDYLINFITFIKDYFKQFFIENKV